MAISHPSTGVTSSFDAARRSTRNPAPTAAATTAPATEAAGRARRPHALLELGLLALLYVGYSGARLLTGASMNTATAHAYDLLHIEDLLHLDVERYANQALDASPVLALLGSYWYSLLHYVVTPAVLLWAYRARPVHYRRVRNALVAGTAIGLAGFTLLPMAPPRMLPGYVDTLATTAQHGWWGGDASAPRGLGALTNQLAAMPSLHVGWALWCAWVVYTLTRRTWIRVLAVLYPIGTTLVVIGTANHYLLDAVAGVAVMIVGIWLTRRRWTCDCPELAAAKQQGRAVGATAIPSPRSAPTQPSLLTGPMVVAPMMSPAGWSTLTAVLASVVCRTRNLLRSGSPVVDPGPAEVPQVSRIG
jgi:PAP2 superfamily protein